MTVEILNLWDLDTFDPEVVKEIEKWGFLPEEGEKSWAQLLVVRNKLSEIIFIEDDSEIYNPSFTKDLSWIPDLLNLVYQLDR